VLVGAAGITSLGPSEGEKHEEAAGGRLAWALG